MPIHEVKRSLPKIRAMVFTRLRYMKLAPNPVSARAANMAPVVPAKGNQKTPPTSSSPPTRKARAPP